MSTVRVAYYLAVALLVVSLAAFLVIGAELRSYAALGLVLCVTLFAGVLWRPTRWPCAGLTLFMAAIAYLLLRQ